MRLPWYVALDRWVRRHTIGWICVWALVYTMSFVGLIPLITRVPEFLAALIGVAHILALLSVKGQAEEALEHYADKWREEH